MLERVANRCDAAGSMAKTPGSGDELDVVVVPVVKERENDEVSGGLADNGGQAPTPVEMAVVNATPMPAPLTVSPRADHDVCSDAPESPGVPVEDASSTAFPRTIPSNIEGDDARPVQSGAASEAEEKHLRTASWGSTSSLPWAGASSNASTATSTAGLSASFDDRNKSERDVVRRQSPYSSPTGQRPVIQRRRTSQSVSAGLGAGVTRFRRMTAVRGGAVVVPNGRPPVSPVHENAPPAVKEPASAKTSGSMQQWRTWQGANSGNTIPAMRQSSARLELFNEEDEEAYKKRPTIRISSVSSPRSGKGGQFERSSSNPGVRSKGRKLPPPGPVLRGGKRKVLTRVRDLFSKNRSRHIIDSIDHGVGMGGDMPCPVPAATRDASLLHPHGCKCSLCVSRLEETPPNKGGMGGYGGRKYSASVSPSMQHQYDRYRNSGGGLFHGFSSMLSKCIVGHSRMLELPAALFDILLRDLCSAMLVTAVLTIILNIIQLELTLQRFNDNEEDGEIVWVIFGVRALAMALAIITCYCVVRYHQLKLIVGKRQFREDPGATLFNSHNSSRIMLELVVCAIHVLPWTLNGMTMLSIRLDLQLATYTTLLSFFRAYLVLRYVRVTSFLLRQGAVFVSFFAQVRPSTSLVLRSLLVLRPYRFSVFIIGTVFSFVTYMVYLSERLTGLGPLWDRNAAEVLGVIPGADATADLSPGEEYQLSLSNAAWLVVATVTTVGYGDAIPSTQLSRFIAGLGALFGILFSSLMVAVISNKLSLNSNEEKFLHFLRRHDAYQKYRHSAATLIKKRIAFHLAEKDGSTRPEDMGRMRSYLLDRRIRRTRCEMHGALREWKTVKREWHGLPLHPMSVQAISESLRHDFEAFHRSMRFVAESMMVLTETSLPLEMRSHITVPRSLVRLRSALGAEIFELRDESYIDGEQYRAKESQAEYNAKLRDAYRLHGVDIDFQGDGSGAYRVSKDIQDEANRALSHGADGLPKVGNTTLSDKERRLSAVDVLARSSGSISSDGADGDVRPLRKSTDATMRNFGPGDHRRVDSATNGWSHWVNADGGPLTRDEAKELRDAVQREAEEANRVMDPTLTTLSRLQSSTIVQRSATLPMLLDGVLSSLRASQVAADSQSSSLPQSSDSPRGHHHVPPGQRRPTLQQWGSLPWSMIAGPIGDEAGTGGDPTISVGSLRPSIREGSRRATIGLVSKEAMPDVGCLLPTVVSETGASAINTSPMKTRTRQPRQEERFGSRFGDHGHGDNKDNNSNNNNNNNGVIHDEDDEGIESDDSGVSVASEPAGVGSTGLSAKGAALLKSPLQSLPSVSTMDGHDADDEEEEEDGHAGDPLYATTSGATQRGMSVDKRYQSPRGKRRAGGRSAKLSRSRLKKMPAWKRAHVRFLNVPEALSEIFAAVQGMQGKMDEWSKRILMLESVQLEYLDRSTKQLDMLQEALAPPFFGRHPRLRGRGRNAHGVGAATAVAATDTLSMSTSIVSIQGTGTDGAGT